MTSSRPFSIRTETVGTLVRVVVTLTAAASSADRDALLGPGIVELVPALVDAASVATGEGSAVVVDIRCDASGSASARSWEAFIEAARGLVQSFVLERTPPAAPVNIVVSGAAQDADRAATWRYLGSADGGFSWGATYDLRGVTA